MKKTNETNTYEQLVNDYRVLLPKICERGSIRNKIKDIMELEKKTINNLENLSCKQVKGVIFSQQLTERLFINYLDKSVYEPI